jgi:predicted ATPase
LESADIKRALCPVTVGRQDELALIEDALREALAGRGGMILLAGDAGLGKTRVCVELAGLAESLGAAVLSGASPETDLALPYLPFVEAIGKHLAGVDKSWLQQLGDARHELAKLFPQIKVGARPELDDPVRAKLRLFEAIASVVKSIAAPGVIRLQNISTS